MIIAIASGKGGTGKTLVAVSLALTAHRGRSVALLDCDAEEPNCHIFIKPLIEEVIPVTIPVPFVNQELCTHCGKCAEACLFNAIASMPKTTLVFENLCHGCGACSLACDADALVEKGRRIGIVEKGTAGADLMFIHGKLDIGEMMSPPIIRAIKKHLPQNGELAIIDSPPGTSCPVVESVKGSNFVILVTEPTPFGLNDLKLAVEMVRKVGIPCGVLINRADMGDKAVKQYCEDEKIPVMLEIPFQRRIAESYSSGVPLVEDQPQWREKFTQLLKEIEEIVK